MKDTIYRQDAINVLEKLSACEEYGVEVGTDEETYIGKYEAITAISDLPSADRPSATEIMNAYHEGVRKGIAEAYETYRPQWIPCSERLPEYGVPVLTWDGSMWTTEQRIPFILDDDFNRIYSEWWVDADFDEDYEDAGYYPNLRDGAAIAWMPLPEPWKGADDEDV